MTTEQLAYRVRKHAVMMTNRGNSSHIGSTLSIADIIAVLYGQVMNHDPDNPKWPERDRFILSKGHAGTGIYAVLAECGYFDPKILEQHCQNGSKLSGHVSHIGIPGVELSTGSLGHGLSVGVGMAYAAKLDDKKHRVFTLMSDGEWDEGSNWEAAIFAGHHRLSNLIAIIDYNKIQSLAPVAEVLNLEPFADKFSAFGWRVIEVDGHDHDDLIAKLDVQPGNVSAPTAIIANTVKGKGVSFMEHQVLWHYRTPQDEEFEAAMSELEERYGA
ncbi:MAG: transketolase [FCB group bacterium]|nr:transketolase [FCB group bacterium]